MMNQPEIELVTADGAVRGLGGLITKHWLLYGGGADIPRLRVGKKYLYRLSDIKEAIQPPKRGPGRPSRQESMR